MVNDQWEKSESELVLRVFELAEALVPLVQVFPDAVDYLDFEVSWLQ